MSCPEELERRCGHRSKRTWEATNRLALIADAQWQRSPTDAPASPTVVGSGAILVPGLAARHITQRVITRTGHDAMGQRRYEYRMVTGVGTGLGR